MFHENVLSYNCSSLPISFPHICQPYVDSPSSVPSAPLIFVCVPMDNLSPSVSPIGSSSPISSLFRILLHLICNLLPPQVLVSLPASRPSPVLRRSLRTIVKPSYLGDYICNSASFLPLYPIPLRFLLVNFICMSLNSTNRQHHTLLGKRLCYKNFRLLKQTRLEILFLYLLTRKLFLVSGYIKSNKRLIVLLKDIK